MITLVNWRFWLAFTLVPASLSCIGFLIAGLIVAEPPEFFRASYFEFSLPKGWQCDREGTESICEPKGDPPFDAIIILTAKERNENDDRDDYLDHLSKPKNWVDSDGNQRTSKTIYLRKSNIGEYEWIDGLHRNSELQNYTTRYLATVTSHLGVLVTFSARNEKYEAWNTEFEKTIKSLRIYQYPSVFN
jgi:hypothetical protein